METRVLPWKWGASTRLSPINQWFGSWVITRTMLNNSRVSSTCSLYIDFNYYFSPRLNLIIHISSWESKLYQATWWWNNACATYHTMILDTIWIWQGHEFYIQSEVSNTIWHNTLSILKHPCTINTTPKGDKCTSHREKKNINLTQWKINGLTREKMMKCLKQVLRWASSSRHRIFWKCKW